MLFTLKIYSFGPNIAFKSFFTTKDAEFRKNQFLSNIFTFLSVIRKNFEYNLRFLANFGNFHVRTMDFAHTFSKNYRLFFFVFFNKDYTFYTKNLFIQPKNCVQSILYNERWKKFRKN